MVIDASVEKRSLKKEALKEANNERWVRSEEAGRDLGEYVIRQWVRQHWHGFLRARWIEHLVGERFWLELPREEFGLLRDFPPELRPMIDSFLEQLRCGGENLTIMCWGRGRAEDDRRVIRELLHKIDINGHRLQCDFADECVIAPAQ